MKTETQTLLSPVTGQVIGELVETKAAAVHDAVSRASTAVQELRNLTAWQRADLLVTTAQRLEQRRDQAVEDLVLEHGKTRHEAEAEFDMAVAGMRSTAEYVRRLDGRLLAVADPAKTVLVERQPLGVVAAITPWNVPFLVPIEYAAPALAMGNSVVWKPAESVPRTAAHVAAAFSQAGWPPDAFSMIPGGPRAGAALASDRRLAALCFTGSSEVGLQLSEIGGMRKLIAELGGNGPSIVFADADLGKAADRITAGACFLSGQSCAATERVLVERAAYKPLLEALVERARAEQVGDPRLPETTLGPIHLEETSEKIARHLAGARAGGAHVLAGGERLANAPTQQYWPLAVISDVTPDMEIFHEETFGPVIPVMPFDSEESARTLAETGRYGLAAAIFTRDLGRVFRVADWLAASSVVVNDTSNFWEMHLPWGGGPGTRSGIGRLGGEHALIELSTTKSLTIDRS